LSLFPRQIINFRSHNTWWISRFWPKNYGLST